MSQSDSFIITEESEKRPGAGELNKRIGDLTNPFAFFAWFAVRHHRSPYFKHEPFLVFRKFAVQHQPCPKILFNREKRENRKNEIARFTNNDK